MIKIKASVNLNGLMKIRRNARVIKNKIFAEIHWRTLLTDEFLQKYTDFKSFSEIEHMDLNEIEKPEFIIAHTKFKSAIEMQEKAIAESPIAQKIIQNVPNKVSRQLFKGL